LVAVLATSWNCVQHAGGKTARAVIIPALCVLAPFASLPALLVAGAQDVSTAIALG